MLSFSAIKLLKPVRFQAGVELALRRPRRASTVGFRSGARRVAAADVHTSLGLGTSAHGAAHVVGVRAGSSTMNRLELKALLSFSAINFFL